ncbi:MAG: OmpA family protein, partial [bacterium]
DGRYAYSFLAEDTGGGQALSKEDVVLVDATPPTVTLSASTTIFMPSLAPPATGLAPPATGLAQGATAPAAGLPAKVTFDMSAQDASGVERWRLSIHNSQQKTVKTFEGRGAIGAGAGLAWDGRDDYYERAVERDTYTVRLVAYDPYGSRGMSPDLQVVVGAPPAAPAPKKPAEPKFMTVNLSSKLLFSAKRWTLKPQAYDEIDQKVVKVLKQYPETRVSIEGHTDKLEGGGRLMNLELSSKRAWSIYGYLARRGIARARMSVKGWGPDRPIDSNVTAIGRERNRRVEVIIFGRKQVK